MTVIRNPRLRHGHAPGHVRETFAEAVGLFLRWRRGQAEPMVDHEVNYELVSVPISRACTLVWNCSDIMPGDLFFDLRNEDLEMKSSTYAACARAMYAAIQSRLM